MSQFPQFGLIQLFSGDPTAGAGASGLPYEFLYRTDNGTLYIKTGSADTAWTLVAAGAPTGSGGGGGVSLYGGFYGDGLDGDQTIAVGTTTQTQDMHYNNLTVDGTLDPGGYRTFVKGTLTLNGKIARNGNNGQDSTSGPGGTGGAALASGSIPGSVGGGNGGAQGGGVGGNVSSANTPRGFIFNSTTAHGQNAAGVGVGGGGGSGGTNGGGASLAGGTSAVTRMATTNGNSLSLINAINMRSVNGTQFTGACGGGGGGANSLAGTGGAGGGGGGGGCIVLCAKTIVGSGTVECNGGNGGIGDDSVATPPGRGGGGGGGAGGVIVVVTSGAFPTCLANGGTGGAGASGGAENGGNGGAGYILQYLVP